MPEEKEKLISLIDRFLSLDTEDAENFILAKRTGIFRYLHQFLQNPTDRRVLEVGRLVRSKFSTIDDAILEILRNYI